VSSLIRSDRYAHVYHERLTPGVTEKGDHSCPLSSALGRAPPGAGYHQGAVSPDGRCALFVGKRRHGDQEHPWKATVPGAIPCERPHALAGRAGDQRCCGVSQGAPVSPEWRGDGSGASRPPWCLTTTLWPAGRSWCSPDRGGRGQGQGQMHRGRAERLLPCAACNRSIDLGWCP
jgi:hypothetical protein